MGEPQEAVVRSLIACLDVNDQRGALEHYAENAVYHMVLWRKPMVGREAIRASFASARWARAEIVNIASTEAVVFVESVDTVVRDGKDVTVHYSMVLEIDGDGKITAERDYWDAKEMDAQLA